MKLRNVVCANEIEEFCLRKTAAVIAHGVDGIRGPAAPDFLGIDFVARLSGLREA